MPDFNICILIACSCGINVVLAGAVSMNTSRSSAPTGMATRSGSRSSAPWDGATSCPNPFKIANEVHLLVPGMSLWEILLQIQPDISAYMAHVWVNNDYIPPDKWKTTYPAYGSEITIRVIPQGGGGKGRMIGMVLIAIAAVAVTIIAPYLGAPMWAASSLLRPWVSQAT
jgi:hypothetical protein